MDTPVFAAAVDFWRWLFTSPVTLALLGFQAWMLIDAVRNREWIWAVFILVCPGLGSFWYFFNVYRGSGSAMRGFELPGAFDRTRIKHLEAQIHHLDKAHHYSQLGDIYFQQGKLDKAEACYRSSLERDPQEIDTRAHFGQCLLRQHKPKEARPILEGVVTENPKHEYGYSLMALAETYMALGETDAAIATWQRVTENHDYARARVQLAQLLIVKGQKEEARAALNEVLADFPHTPSFHRKRDRVWVRRAKKLMGQTG
jgi:tetratricopeptide (TPR) repeat protein